MEHRAQGEEVVRVELGQRFAIALTFFFWYVKALVWYFWPQYGDPSNWKPF